MTLIHYEVEVSTKTERSQRIVADFRIYRFEWENKRKNGDGKICCVLCGWGIESVMHLIEDYKGTELYLFFILKMRKEYL